MSGIRSRCRRCLTSSQLQHVVDTWPPTSTSWHNTSPCVETKSQVRKEAPRARADSSNLLSALTSDPCCEAYIHLPDQHTLTPPPCPRNMEAFRIEASDARRHPILGASTHPDHKQEARSSSLEQPIPESDIHTTVVPAGLFEQLLRAGQQARRRGQHCLTETPDGVLTLTAWAPAEPACATGPAFAAKLKGTGAGNLSAAEPLGADRTPSTWTRSRGNSDDFPSLKACSPRWLEMASWEMASWGKCSDLDFVMID